MEKQVIIYTIVAVVALVTIGIAFYVRRKYPKPTDYRAIFILGITWTIIALANKSILFGLGAIALMVSGYLRRDKWKENRFRWSKLSLEEKRIKIGLLTTIGVAVLTILGLYYV